MENSSAPLPSDFPNKNVITPMHANNQNNSENSSDSEDSGNFTPFDPNKPQKKKKNKKNKKDKNKIEILDKDAKVDLKYKINL